MGLASGRFGRHSGRVQRSLTRTPLAKERRCSSSVREDGWWGKCKNAACVFPISGNMPCQTPTWLLLAKKRRGEKRAYPSLPERVHLSLAEEKIIGAEQLASHRQASAFAFGAWARRCVCAADGDSAPAGRHLFTPRSIRPPARCTREGVAGAEGVNSHIQSPPVQQKLFLPPLQYII
jgi:hypothetical protein